MNPSYADITLPSDMMRHSVAPKFVNHLHTPEITEGHALHLYVVRFKEKGVRNKAYHFLKQHDILSQVHYIPLTDTPTTPATTRRDFPEQKPILMAAQAFPSLPNDGRL